MYRECSDCKNKRVIDRNDDTISGYFQWKTRKESRVGAKNKMFNVTVTSREKVTCTITEIIKEINTLTPPFFKHVYDSKHQFSYLKNNKLGLDSNEVQVVIDFSENYVCKCSSEIQDAHFGASQKQLSLHTGVFYYILCTMVYSITYCVLWCILLQRAT